MRILVTRRGWASREQFSLRPPLFVASRLPRAFDERRQSSRSMRRR